MSFNRMLRQCKVDGCVNPQRAKNLCSTHYSRMRRGTPIDRPVQSFSFEVRRTPAKYERKETCTVEGCVNFQRAKGLCMAHYSRVKRHGDVQAHIPLSGSAKIVPCSVDFCSLPSLVRGLCEAHYYRERVMGSVLDEVPLRKFNTPYGEDAGVSPGRSVRSMKIKEGNASNTPKSYKSMYDGRCAYCLREVIFDSMPWSDSRSEKRASVDHIRPLVKEGEHEYYNTVLSCWRCNSVKGDRTLEEFISLLEANYTNVSDEALENIRALVDVVRDVEVN